ncbi:hypothetical protein WR25_13946 isoform C [Diploscapter pachys]|nr:hypothetical protein WR25_13946 isoform C [Diploscapter pachys]
MLIPEFFNAFEKYEKDEKNAALRKEVLNSEQLAMLDQYEKETTNNNENDEVEEEDSKKTEEIEKLPLHRDSQDEMPDPTSNCRSGWSYYNGSKSCFKKIMKMVDWQEAVDICEKEGAFLASLLDEAENRFAADLTRINTTRDIDFIGQVWIGGKRDPRDRAFWYWTDGSEIKWFAWTNGVPNDSRGAEDCLQLVSTPNSYFHFQPAYMWNDSGCVSNAYKNYPLCKYRALK